MGTAAPVAHDHRRRRLRSAIIVVSVLVAVAGVIFLATRDWGDKVTTRGVTTTLRGLPGHPGSVAAGTDALWFARVDGTRPVRKQPLLRLDLASDKLTRTVDIGGQAAYLLHTGGTLLASVAHEGSEGAGPSLISAFDWRTGQLKTTRQERGAVGPLVRDGDDLWALQTRPGALLRLDPRTLIHKAGPVELPAGQSLGLEVGAGYVWVAASDAGEVLRIDPATRKITSLRVGGYPVGIVIAGHTLWVADRERGTVARFDPETLRSIGDPVRVGREPSLLVASGDYLFVGRGGSGTVVRIAVRSGRKLGKPIRFAQQAAGASGFSFAPSGTSIWVSSFASSTLTRISSTGSGAAAPAATVSNAQRVQAAQGRLPRGARIGHTIAVPKGAGSLAIGEGSVWSLNDDSKLLRIDPRKNEIVERIPVKAGGDAAVADGSIWLTHPDSRTVSRMDAKTYKLGATIKVGLIPLGIAVTPTSVWVANAGGPSVSRIDPATNKVVATIRLGPVSMCCSQHMSIVVAGHAVWVEAPQGNRLVRIDPATNETTIFQLGFSPCAGLVAHENTVWVAGGACGDVVGRLDVRTKRLVNLVEPHPIGLASACGAIWVANLRSQNVDQLDSLTHQVVSRLPVGGIPIQLLFGFGSLWMHDADGRILRIEPAR